LIPDFVLYAIFERIKKLYFSLNGFRKMVALRGNRTPGGSSSQNSDGNDPGYHYPINACKVCDRRLYVVRGIQ
jgi:hypothetical protein